MTDKLHVQIALVGGSPTPVYQGIVHIKPRQVILACSRQTRLLADSIKEQLQLFAAEELAGGYTDKDVFIYELSDNDLSKMYDIAETIVSSLSPEVQLSLNLTSGMKLWSLIFDEVFSSQRPDCLRFTIGQDGTLFNLTDKTFGEKVAFDMYAQFKLLGHHLDASTPLQEYTEEDEKVLNKVWSINKTGTGFKYFAFHSITAKFLETYQKANQNILMRKDFGVTSNKPDSDLSWVAETRTFECRLGYSAYTFSSEHVEHIVLNTGWFEYYVAHLVGKIYQKEKVWLNCLFKDVNNQAKNEIDIIADMGSRLLFVECKTQVYESTDVDKFRTAVRNYGGLGSIPLFVTLLEMKDLAREKCVDSKITTFYINNPAYKSETEVVEALRVLLKDLAQKWNV